MSSDLSLQKWQSIESWRIDVEKHLRDGDICKFVIADIDPKLHDTLSVCRPLIRTQPSNVLTLDNLPMPNSQEHSKELDPKLCKVEEQRHVAERLFGGLHAHETKRSKQAWRNVETVKDDVTLMSNIDMAKPDTRCPVLNVDPHLAPQASYMNIVHRCNSVRGGQSISKTYNAKTTSKASTYHSQRPDNNNMIKVNRNHHIFAGSKVALLTRAAVPPTEGSVHIGTGSTQYHDYTPVTPMYEPSNSNFFINHHTRQLFASAWA